MMMLLNIKKKMKCDANIIVAASADAMAGKEVR